MDSEVSYLDGKVVSYGTKGSIRIDALIGTAENPREIYDLKTGQAGLIAKRIAEIRAQLPEAIKNTVKIIELRRQ